VLRNLISNAIKFTDEGGQVLVEIKSTNSDNGVSVEYSVSDTGKGISQKQLSTMLRPFASARFNQTQGQDGMGVGLSLSHKLINLMHSSLHVASKEGKGSRFFFNVAHAINEASQFEFVKGSKMAIFAEESKSVLQSKLLKNYLENFEVDVTVLEALESPFLEHIDALFILTNHITKERIATLRSHYPSIQIIPVIEPQYENKFDKISDLFESHLVLPILPDNLFETLSVIWKKVPKEFLKKTVSKGINNDQSARILVAEDNPINLKLIQTILLQNKYKVIAVDNGQKAVDLYLKESFDLILMDIDMPVMDGITATRLIHAVDSRNNRKSTPIIALTAHALSGDRERIMGAGLDAHLAKPIDKDFLLQTIASFIDQNTPSTFALSEAV
ncbi:MAG TPA: response regulator, partial [Helicobacteraceae bacterium]|nr:response regulator [Helicobacteraceae bacterium]